MISTDSEKAIVKLLIGVVVLLLPPKLHAQFSGTSPYFSKFSVQLSVIPPLVVVPQVGLYKPTSYATIGWVASYSKFKYLSNRFRLGAELSVGSAPYKTGFYFSSNELSVLDGKEYPYLAKINFYHYSQLAVLAGYDFGVSSSALFNVQAGIAVRRNVDGISVNRASYTSAYTGSRETVFELTTYSNKNALTMLSVPFGMYYEHDFAKRLRLSLGIRATVFFADWLTGDYIFFSGLPQESYGRIAIRKFYIGLDLGICWTKNKKYS